MKIPGGAIPPQPPQGPGGAGKTQGAQGAQGTQGTHGAQFDAKTDATRDAAASQGAARETQATQGPQAAELRQALQGVDPKSPEAMQRLSDKLVDWSLSDQFGAGALDAKGVEQLKAEILQQLQDDPTAAARLQGILDQL